MESDKQNIDDKLEKPHFAEYSLGTGTEMIQNDEDWGLTEVGKRSPEERGYYGKGPKNWKGMDERILDEACEALFVSYAVDATDIEVHVKDREIILNGFVSSTEEKKEAQRCLDHIHGVAGVSNNLVIRSRKDSSLVGGNSDKGMI